MKRDNQRSNIQRFAAAVDSGKYRTEKEITSDALPVLDIQKEYYRLRKETTDKAKHKAPPLPDTPQELRPERTYTKNEVIDLLKAFYIREYGKLDDRAYTLVGFLLTALDEMP